MAIYRFLNASGIYNIAHSNRIYFEIESIGGVTGAQVFEYKMSGIKINLEATTYIKTR